jgi:hypothetical protein
MSVAGSELSHVRDHIREVPDRQHPQPLDNLGSIEGLTLGF